MRSRRALSALPALPAAFVGRDVDVDAVCARVAPGRVVTVRGPPGIGKSTVLAAVAARAADGGRVFVVDVDGCVDRAAVVAAAARAAAVAVRDVDRAWADVVDAVAGCVVVIDHVDAVAADVRDAVVDLVGADVAVVCGAWSALGVDGEHVWELLPLAHDDARALTQTLLAWRAPRMALSDVDVDDLCAATGGVPLALELAVAAWAALGKSAALHAWAAVDDITPARDLHTHDQHDTREKHDKHDKHDHSVGRRPLQRALAASFALLSPPEQQALLRVALPRGPLSLPVARALVDDAVLVRLRDTSWLHAPSADTLACLPPVRAFAAAQAAARGVNVDDVFCAVGRAYAAVVDDAPHSLAAWPRHQRERADRERAWRALHARVQPRRERPIIDDVIDGVIDRAVDDRAVDDNDLAVAIALALSLEPVLLAVGPAAVAEEIFGATSAWASTSTTAAARRGRFALRLALGRTLALHARHRAAAAAFRACVDDDDARAAVSDVDHAFALASLAYAQRFLGALDDAAAHTARAHAVAVAHVARGGAGLVDALRLLSFTEQMHGSLALERGAFDDAEAAYRRALAAARRAEAPRAQGIAWGNLGLLARARFDVDGDPRHLDEQGRCLAEARAQFALTGERLLVARVTSDAATLAALRGAADADAQLHAALVDARAEGCPVSAFACHAALAALAHARGDDNAAALAVDDAAAVAADVDDVGVARRMAALQHLVAPRAGALRLELKDDGRVVVVDGVVIDFARRGPLRRVLLALGRATGPLSADDVLAAGWPGERMQPASGAARVYMAIRRLRDLGLARALVTVDDGYVLRGVDVRWS
jgi:hypothetical protein